MTWQETVKQEPGKNGAGNPRKPSLPTGPTPSAVAKPPTHTAPKERKRSGALQAGMGAIPYSSGVAFRVWGA